MSKERARCYLLVDNGVVVGKRAIGPEPENGVEVYPAPPSDAVEVPFEVYARVGLTWSRDGEQWVPPRPEVQRRSVEERLARLEAQMAGLQDAAIGVV